MIMFRKAQSIRMKVGLGMSGVFSGCSERSKIEESALKNAYVSKSDAICSSSFSFCSFTFWSSSTELILHRNLK